MASRLGPMWLNQVQQLAAPTHAGRLSRYAVLAEQVNALEPALEKRDRRPARASGATRCRLKARQGDSLNSLLVEAFALVREAAKRTIKQRHYDVQLVGGAAIHNRCIAEMETGEGKTLVATLPAYLNALQGKGVHVVTVNDYLAHRDADWMTPIYKHARHDRRLHPDRPARRRPPGRLCLRHHLRHEQGVRLRLPPRRAEAAPARRRRHRKIVRAGLPRPRRATPRPRSPSSAPTTSRSSTRPTAS